VRPILLLCPVENENSDLLIIHILKEELGKGSHPLTISGLFTSAVY